MKEYLDRIEQALTIPAAEYVPAIGDVFLIIQEARKALDAQEPVAEVVAGTENYGAVQFSGPIPPKGTKLYTARGAQEA